MKFGIAGLGAIVATFFLSTPVQETPKPMVSCYDSLADAILAIKNTESEFVRSLLDGHFHAARAYWERGDYGRASAEMALFASEGDNAIGGVRKRLLEGGHHHNAAGEAKGLYEPGFVVVTREAKQKVLAAAAAVRQASDDGERKQAWNDFTEVVETVMKTK